MRSMRSRGCGALLGLLAAALIGSPLAARGATSFTSEPLFLEALETASPAELDRFSVLDFDDLSADTLLPSGTVLDGVELVYAIPGQEAQVRAEFDTPSPPNYVGLDSLDGAFVSGDSLTLRFDAPVHAVGLLVTSETGSIQPMDFELRTETGSVARNGAVPERTLSDGEAFFIGLIDSDGFGQITLESFDPRGAGLFVYNLDDVTVAALPEPDAGLLLVGVIVVGAARRRFRPSEHGKRESR